jgi:hypothetical protein
MDPMKENYRICLIVPEGNPHSLCFREVGLLLLSALKSNGYECDFSFNKLAEDRINIILGYHLLQYEEGLKKYRYIPYQLEQLHTREFPFSQDMGKILRSAISVWDYSQENIIFLKNLGIHAQHLVPGYHENLEIIPTAPRQGIDILFYGSIGERRRGILEKLAGMCKLKTLFGVYGEKRDKWICRSKININIHHYSKMIFETVRVSFLLNNGCFIVSETSVDYSYDKVNLIMVPYENIIDTCIKYLNQPQLMETKRKEDYDNFKSHYPMTELIRQVI